MDEANKASMTDEQLSQLHQAIQKLTAVVLQLADSVSGAPAEPTKSAKAKPTEPAKPKPTGQPLEAKPETVALAEKHGWYRVQTPNTTAWFGPKKSDDPAGWGPDGRYVGPEDPADRQRAAHYHDGKWLWRVRSDKAPTTRHETRPVAPLRPPGPGVVNPYDHLVTEDEALRQALAYWDA